jgi:uncharacterized protein (TIGR02421 family)
MDDLPMGDAEPPSRPLTPFEQTIRDLGDRLVAAQRPIRVLDGIQWDARVEHAFLSHDGRELPPVTADTYAARPLRFDPAAKADEFRAIERDCLRKLGRDEPLGRLLRRRCRQYRGAVAMLARRGTPEFARLSRELYGGPDRVEDAEVTAVFAALARHAPHRTDHPAALDAGAAVAVLDARLRRSLPAGHFRVKLADGILADAAAGCDYIKLRRDARFTPSDLALLEVHEGWAHLGTTLNGRRQPVCSFLGKGPPATTGTQEGLAVLCEVLAGVCHAGRVRRLWRRYQAVRRADAGADFRDVYRYFLEASDDPRDSYHQAARVFRGSLPAGCGPFAKDLAYALGFTRVLHAVRVALRSGRAYQIALLFTGKTALDELPALGHLAASGVLRRPAFLPPPVGEPPLLTRVLAELLGPPRPLPRPHLFDETAPAPSVAPPAQPLSFLKDPPRPGHKAI